jgi:Trypsin-like peptidase domain
MTNEENIPVWAKSSVIAVGEGRGFIVSDNEANLLIITAAHCLPYFPPCHAMSNTSDRTYQKLLAPLGEEPSVWAECMFADPIADIAVLGSPDTQDLFKQAEVYEELVASRRPLPIAMAAPKEGPAWLLSLEGEWFSCRVQYIGSGPLWLAKTAEPIRGGMSGSPVVVTGGEAIGIVSCGEYFSPDETPKCEDEFGSKNPRLTRDLPGWILPQP